jgi:hypothetical protein
MPVYYGSVIRAARGRYALAILHRPDVRFGIIGKWQSKAAAPRRDARIRQRRSSVSAEGEAELRHERMTGRRLLRSGSPHIALPAQTAPDAPLR